MEWVAVDDYAIHVEHDSLQAESAIWRTIRSGQGDLPQATKPGQLVWAAR